MCGGAIISDFVPDHHRRKLTTRDLWLELDPFSDFSGMDHHGIENRSNESNNKTTSPKPEQINKGEIYIGNIAIIFSYINTNT